MASRWAKFYSAFWACNFMLCFRRNEDVEEDWVRPEALVNLSNTSDFGDILCRLEGDRRITSRLRKTASALPMVESRIRMWAAASCLLSKVLTRSKYSKNSPLLWCALTLCDICHVGLFGYIIHGWFGVSRLSFIDALETLGFSWWLWHCLILWRATMATGSSSWDMMQRRPRDKLGGVSLNLGTKSQLVSVEGISDADAEKIMDLRGSSGELSFTTLLLETAITEEQMLQWARDKVVKGHFKDFDLEMEAAAPLPLDYLGKTVAQLSLEMKELSNRMAGVEDGQHQLSGNLRHVGDTADRGLALASQLSASRDQFFQSVESQQEEWMAGVAQKHEEMMNGMAQKHKSFWDSMRSQFAVQDKAITAIQQRQDEVLKELPDRDAGLQTTGQTSSSVPSLSWDYRLGALRAQQDQLLADQEAMASRRTSIPMDERTFLKHMMEGVTGGVHTGGAGYLEMVTLRPTQPARTDMVPGHLRPFRLMEFPDPRQRDTDDLGGRQVGTGYPFRDAGDPPPYLPSRLRAQDDGYTGDPSVPQPYRQSHMTSRQRTQEGGILVTRQFHGRRWRTCALTTRRREWRTLERLPGENASRQGRSSLLRQNSSRRPAGGPPLGTRPTHPPATVTGGVGRGRTRNTRRRGDISGMEDRRTPT